MGSFPGPKVHRSSRRQLGRGQSVQAPAATVDASASTVTVTITFDVPVVVSGTIPLTHSGVQTLVSQTVISPTVVHQVYSATMAGATWAIAANPATVRTFQGGGVAAASGTF
jgi:hypothetical protein